ncbi:MAG TPA: urocanate hydratase [Euryarchaeota archaeon]|nr:urocanate hydratase [Euryarchaeota archaeon]
MTGENRTFKAPRGTDITCKGWRQESLYRMLMNNLENAEMPEELIIYGGTGKCARNWEAFDTIVKSLHELEEDETLLMQSGKPVGMFKTHPDAPRVLLTNSNLVPHWSNWEEFHKLEEKGLTVYGQMTAGGWAYIGTQGIIQGTYETFAECARQNFHGTLKGRFVVTGGCGGMGGAQPLAVTMAEGVAMVVEVDPKRIERRVNVGYCDVMMDSLDEALCEALSAKEDGRPLSIGLVGNCAEVLPEMVKKGLRPDVVTDQTSAHDALNGYVPANMTLEESFELRKSDPDEHIRRSKKSMAIHVKAMLDFQQSGSVVFDYGNNIRAQAFDAGVKNAFDFKGFVPLYIRPMFCEGRGPFRWIAMSGDTEDIKKTDRVILETFPDDDILRNWITLAQKKVPFEGLPARVCWLAFGDRAKFALKVNEMVNSGELKAPIVVTRDHLDCGSVASPNRETEGMLDGSDAIADWPLLSALINTSAGADCVALHNGGGVGIGYSMHSGMHVVLDGTLGAAERARRVFTTDSGMGIIRHADAGYSKAKDMAKKHNIKIPMMK